MRAAASGYNERPAMAERDKSPKPRPHDVVLVHGRTADGRGVRALRSRPNRLDLAELRPATEGQPIQPGAEIVHLKRREESELLWDVDVKFRHDDRQGEAQGLGAGVEPEGEAEASNATGRSGPAQVATDRYRANWEAIFRSPSRRTLN